MRQFLLLGSILLFSTSAMAAMAGQSSLNINPVQTSACINGKITTQDGRKISCVETVQPKETTHRPRPDTRVVFVAPPNFQLSLRCPAGQFLSSINGNVGTCSSPSVPQLTVSCAPGQYLVGLQEGSPICAPVQAGSFVQDSTRGCLQVNKSTGQCSCPASYAAVGTYQVSATAHLYLCYKN
ncbi:MAG: hypothetical protein AB7E52_04700 [Bdellovibrionales bacterium]